MKRTLTLMACVIALFLAAGLHAETLGSMQKDLKKLEGERTRLQDGIAAAEKERARVGESQAQRSTRLRMAEEDLTRARGIVGKLDKVRPDYSEELSRRQTELRKSFTGPDGWIPEEKRAVYQEAYNQLPKNYTKQMWEKETADLHTARSLVALKEKDIVALKRDMTQGQSQEDALTRQIAALKKDLDRVNSATEAKQKDLREEEACLAEKRSQQQASKERKDIEARLRSANVAVNNAMMDAMTLAIYKRLFGGFKAPGGADYKETAGKLAETWKRTDNLKTLVEAVRNPAGAARMGTQAGSEIVGIMIQSLDIMKELYGLVGAMYNVETAVGQARYGGALQNATSFDDAFNEIWRKMGVGRSLGRTYTEQRAREIADMRVQDMARGRRSPVGMALAIDASLAQAEKYTREAEEMAKAASAPPEQGSGGGQPAVAKIEGYAVDRSDGSIGFWNSQYPNCSFDDEKGRRGKPNGQWTGSYYFSGNVLYLVIDNLRAQYPPLHTLGIGYTVTLQNATFEDGSATKSIVLYQYSGTPKERRIVKGYPVKTGASDACRTKR